MDIIFEFLDQLLVLVSASLSLDLSVRDGRLFAFTGRLVAVLVTFRCLIIEIFRRQKVPLPVHNNFTWPSVGFYGADHVYLTGAVGGSCCVRLPRVEVGGGERGLVGRDRTFRIHSIRGSPFNFQNSVLLAWHGKCQRLPLSKWSLHQPGCTGHWSLQLLRRPLVN